MRCRAGRFFAWVLVWVLMLVVALASASSAAPRAVRKVALEGEVPPATGGSGAFTSFNVTQDINNADTVVFKGYLASGVGLFELKLGGSVTTVTVGGAPAPGTGGGDYGSPTAVALNDSGEILLASTIEGGTANRGLFFIDSAGVDNLLILHTDVAPGTGGGTYRIIRELNLLSNGDAAFWSSIDNGTTDSGVFTLPSGGSVQIEAWEGQSAPGTGGGVFGGLASDFVATQMNEAGDIGFSTFVTGGTSTFGIFSIDSGVLTSRALLGQTAPGTGGTYSDMISSMPITGTGDIVFNAEATGGSVAEGIFRVDSFGTDSAVALAGDPAPDTGGGTFSQFGNPAANEAGDIAFWASITGGSVSSGIFVRRAGGLSSAAVLEGDVAPETGGGVFSSLSTSPKMNGNGDVLFIASVSGGTATTGVFVSDFVPPHVPALPLSGLGALAVSLAAGGIRMLRRRR